jgi:hypothetical protein
LINHVVRRVGLDELLAEFVPTTDRRQRISHAKALGVLLRSLLVERDPIYRQQEMVGSFAPDAFGLDLNEAAHIGDDVSGALWTGFEADCGSPLTRVVVAAVKRFDVALDELHDDSTSIKFTGQYSQAKGRSLRGKRAPFITAWPLQATIGLTQTAAVHPDHDARRGRAGAVPLQDGRTSDVVTHEETWDALSPGHRSSGLSLRRRLEALQRGRHEPHRPLRGRFPDRPAAHTARGPGVPGVIQSHEPPGGRPRRRQPAPQRRPGIAGGLFATTCLPRSWPVFWL